MTPKSPSWHDVKINDIVMYMYNDGEDSNDAVTIAIVTDKDQNSVEIDDIACKNPNQIETSIHLDINGEADMRAFRLIKIIMNHPTAKDMVMSLYPEYYL